MNLYIVRHGETDWNKKKKIQGLTDIELNEKGIYQANKMKEKLLNVNFDICICSPLKRAVKTAQIIVDQKCDIIVNEALLERCFGNYEGQNSKEANIDIFKIWNLKENCKDNGIESLRDLLERSDLFLKKFKEEYAQYKNVLIVSHGGFIKALYYSLNGYDENTDFLSFHLDNCEVYKHEIPTKIRK